MATVHNFDAVAGTVNMARSKVGLAFITVAVFASALLIATLYTRYFSEYVHTQRVYNTKLKTDIVEELMQTPEEIDLVRLILREKCDGTNCFVYISYPENTKPELYDADKDRGPFLRMISRSGDNATQIREGGLFTAVQKLHCRPENQCGIGPLATPDGMLEIVVYDGPRGEHTNSEYSGIAFATLQ